MKKTLILSLFICMFCGMSVKAETVIPTNVQNASKGCTLVGVRGDYIGDTNLALKRINAIRKEACEKGIKNPIDGKPLTRKDYIPLKWSSDLEYIARIRAAEASVYLSHIRANGKICFTVKAPNGQQSWGEVIAWNFSKTMMDGIQQWYDEKDDWVKGRNAVTGHYEQMINPNNRYIGLASFYSKDTIFPNSTTGEFSSKKDLDETHLPLVKNCIQKVEVKSSTLSNSRIVGIKADEKKKTIQLKMKATVSYSGLRKSKTNVIVFNKIKWKKNTSKIGGYQLQISKNKNFKKYVKTFVIHKNGKMAKSPIKLNRKSKYYVRIRTYKKVNGRKTYSSWSMKKELKTK